MDMDRPYFAIEKVRTNLTYGHLRNYDGSRCSRFWPFGNPPSLQYGAMAGQGRAAKRSLSRPKPLAEADRNGSATLPMAKRYATHSGGGSWDIWQCRFARYSPRL